MPTLEEDFVAAKAPGATQSLDAAFTPDSLENSFTPEVSPVKATSAVSGVLDTIKAGFATIGEAMSRNQLPQAGVPAIEVPRFGEPGTFGRGISEGVAGLIEGATTPEGMALAGLLPVPGAGKVIGPLFLGAGAKAAGEKAGEYSVTGNPQTLGEAAVIGGATALGVGAELFGTLGERRAVLREQGKAPIPLTKAALESPLTPEAVRTPPEAPKLPTAEVTFTDPTIGEAPPAGVVAEPSTLVELPEEAPTEKVVAAAYRDPDTGKVFNTGVQHQHVEGMAPLEDEAALAKLEAGFLTDTGRFVGRPEAARISGNKPYSEDLNLPPESSAGLEVSEGAPVNESTPAGQVEPAGVPETITLYRATSPDESFSTVFNSEKLKEFAHPEIPGEFWTSDPKYADYFRESYGKNAKIETRELPIVDAEKYRVSPIEFKIPPETKSNISEGPGAASTGDVPKASQIKQLTEAIKDTEPVKQSVLSQIKGELGRTYEQISNKAEQAIDNFKTIGARSMAALRGEAQWTDFKDALGKFSGENNRNSFELQEFTKTIRKVIPDKLRREAVVNWIQADGDNAVLAQRAATSDPFRRPGYEVAQRLTPDEMALASNVRSYLDAKLQEGIEAGLLRQGVENYVAQIWDRPNPIVNKLIGEAVSGKLSTSFKFARQRIFESYFEGEQAGFKPKIKDIGALTAIYDQSFSRAIAGRKLIKALHEGKAADGRPLVEISGVSNLLAEDGSPQALLIKPKAKPEDLSGYLPIDHPALRGWKWAGTDPETGASILYQGDMLVHPEIHTHLKNVLGSSALRQNAFFRAVLDTQAVLKQSKLALSGFHFTQEGTHAAAHRVNPFAPGKVDFSVPDQSSLVDHGLQVADYRAYQAFAEGVSGAGSIYERVPIVGKWLTRYNEYLFQEYIPRLKMNMAMDALERNRERYGGKLSDDQLLELTANQSNAAFGAMNYDMLGRNKTLQDFFRLAALAPDFLEARFRFAAQAFTKTGAEQRHALALQGATLYIAARVINQALTSDAQWDPKNAFEIIYNKRKYGLRSVVEDSMHFATDPARFISNRLAPVTKAAIEFATGRDWKGVKRTTLEQFEDLASWLIPITADKQADRSKTDTVLAASGVTVRSATAQQRLYEQIKTFKEANWLISKDEKSGMVSPSEYKDLRDAISNGSDAAARREYEALLHPTDGTKPKTAAQIREHFIDAVRAPFSGSRRVEMQFLKSLDKKGNDLYLEARQERRELALKFIAKQREWMKQK